MTWIENNKPNKSSKNKTHFHFLLILSFCHILITAPLLSSFTCVLLESNQDIKPFPNVLSSPSRNERRTSATSWSGWRATTTTPTAPGNTPTCTWRWSGPASTSVEAKLDRVRRPSCFSPCPPCAEGSTWWQVRNAKMWRQWRRRRFASHCPSKITVIRLIHRDDLFLLKPRSASALCGSRDACPPPWCYRVTADHIQRAPMTSQRGSATEITQNSKSRGRKRCKGGEIIHACSSLLSTKAKPSALQTNC